MQPLNRVPGCRASKMLFDLVLGSETLSISCHQMVRTPD
jgi:hypothetical protein